VGPLTTIRIVVAVVVKARGVRLRNRLSEIEIWCRGAGSNRRHRVFQTYLLPYRAGSKMPILDQIASVSVGQRRPA
jgi:hypothetical protein